MTAYHNEIEPYVANWLRNLISDGVIPAGDVDERSIEDRGCGLHFCTDHLLHSPKYGQLCERCYPRARKPFTRKPDLPEWNEHKLTDESWARWRTENPDQVASLSLSPSHSVDK